MSKKVVLISGGAGFLGSHLCDWFIDHGFKVIAADNLITGSLDNLAHLKKNKDFKFIKQDVSKPFKVAGTVHYVMHFASPASPVDYMNHPLATMLVGSYGTHNLLEIARAKKAVFLMASTSEIYGDPLVHPQVEGYWGNVNTIGPRSIYDEAKRYAEAATFAYKRVYKMDTKIVRIFNTYGPRMQIKDGRVVPNFIDQILNDQPLTVYGDGKQTRSFCYVADLVDGITRLLLSKISGPVNIGNPREFTILQFAELIRKKYNPKAKIIFKPLPQDDPKQRKPNITLAQKELGWEPKVPLEDGIGRTMEYFSRAVSMVTKDEIIAFEREIADIFATGVIRAPVHLRAGREDTLIKIFKDHQIGDDDYVFGFWDSHELALLKGVPREELKQAIVDGKSISLCFPKQKVLCSGIVGSLMGTAAGVAWALKNEGKKGRAFLFCGDMSAETGIFHEAVKYVHNFDLPATFIVCDNGVSVMTDTRATWGTAEPWFKGTRYENKIIYFKYTNGYPHSGLGKLIKF